MLNNLVNTHDVRRVIGRVARGDARGLLDKLRPSSSERVVRQWSDTTPEPTQWWSIPAVRRRWNRMVTGDPALDFPADVAKRHLDGASGLTALSLGCGLGGRELRWAELGVFDRIDAFDIAPAAVEVAEARAREAGFGDRMNFAVRDFTKLEEFAQYDVVIAEHSLHHLAPMPEVVSKIERLLRPGGLFVADEFVGPKRFQWTAAQLRAAQSVLDLFPPERRIAGRAGVKGRVVRPSLLWMYVTDPSEAIDSARIRPTLRDHFDVLDERPYGGAVLHLAFSDISQHFLDDDDPETLALIAAAFEIEDRLMASGDVDSDFATFVCRTRRQAVR